jgi:hypothetical protein
VFATNPEQRAPFFVSEPQRLCQLFEGVWSRPTTLTRLEQGDRRGAQLRALG